MARINLSNHELTASVVFGLHPDVNPRLLQRDENRNPAHTRFEGSKCFSDHRAERPCGIGRLHGAAASRRRRQQVANSDWFFLGDDIAGCTTRQCDRYSRVVVVAASKNNARPDAGAAGDDPCNSPVVWSRARRQPALLFDNHHSPWFRYVISDDIELLGAIGILEHNIASLTIKGDGVRAMVIAQHQQSFLTVTPDPDPGEVVLHRPQSNRELAFAVVKV